ncbi:hypothetical protein F5B19DRAFT_496690 [Rostrohypoxylon terebratum]|nr:hypothetical protein F5B19DRAFT_496690 [Rostrohypoxylon terebratum]
MPRLNHLLLAAAASLSAAPALGRMLINPNPNLNPEAVPCAPGTKMCHEDTVYRCSTRGTWSHAKPCSPPTYCVSDAHTQDAGCVSPRVEPRLSPPFPRPAPRISAPSPRDRRAAASGAEKSSSSSSSGEPRCVECAPRPQLENGLYDDEEPDESAQRPEVSNPFSTTRPTAAQTPAPDVPDILARALSKNETCFDGEVRCYSNDERIEVCMAAHVWADFGPCPNCTQLYDTRVNCTWDFQKDADDFNARLAEFTAAVPVYV